MSVLSIIQKVLQLLPALVPLVVAIQAAVDEDGPGGKKVTPGEAAGLVTAAIKTFGEAAVQLFKKSA